LEVNGVALCWGDGTDGQLGVGTNLAVNSVPAAVGIQPIGSIAAGGHHTCASIGSGGGMSASLVWCWGANDAGQLASPSNMSGKNMPVAAVDKAGVQLLGTTLTGGLSHTCILRTDGTTWCWGSDTMGELGDGATAASSPPVQVAAIGTHARALAAGSHFTCVLLDDGTVDCFGQNDHAQSGQPDGMPVAVATSVGLAGATSVAVGATLGCARLTGATLDCWGNDATVAAVKTSGAVDAIAVGANDRCTARADGVDCVVAVPRVSCP
jgi:alpha-tubulin suppressor-like RCC1 family protein